MKFADYRKRIGTQAELAKNLNIEKSTVSKWETGKAYPRRNLLKKLTYLFNCTESEILVAIDNSLTKS